MIPFTLITGALQSSIQSAVWWFPDR